MLPKECGVKLIADFDFSLVAPSPEGPDWVDGTLRYVLTPEEINSVNAAISEARQVEKKNSDYFGGRCLNDADSKIVRGFARTAIDTVVE